jgi:hypothetical protein
VSLDTGRALKNPGGKVTFLRQSALMGTGVALELRLSGGEKYGDVNPSNDARSTTVSCPPPDPAVTAVVFRADCLPMVRLENLGGPLPETAYSSNPTEGLFLQRLLDGTASGAALMIGSIDGGQYRRLQPPRAVVDWVDHASPPPASRVEYRLLYSQTTARPQTSTANDSYRADVPPQCQPGQLRRPDLEVVGLRTGPSCEVLVDLRNKGPGDIPLDATGAPSQFSVNFSSGTVAKGGITAGAAASQLRAAGATATVTYSSWQISSTQSVTVRIDGDQRIAEADEGNNQLTRTLTCSAPL